MTTRIATVVKLNEPSTGLYDDNTHDFDLTKSEAHTIFLQNLDSANAFNYRVDLSPGKDHDGNWIWKEKTAEASLTAGTDIQLDQTNDPYALRGRIQVEDTSAQADAIVTCVGALADDTVTVNGLVYTAVAGTKGDNTEFSIDGTDSQDAADLADSMTNDTRTGITVPAEDFDGVDSTNAVTVTAKRGGTAGNGIDISSSTGVRLAITGDTAGYLDGGTDVNANFHIRGVSIGTQ